MYFTQSSQPMDARIRCQEKDETGRFLLTKIFRFTHRADIRILC